MLKQNGYEVVSAATEREGLSLFKDEPVDAVILSFEAPGIGNGSVVRRMKEMKPHIPVLLVSRSASVIQFPAADAVVRKSDAPSRLPAVLHNLLNVRFPFFTRWWGNWMHRA